MAVDDFTGRAEQKPHDVEEIVSLPIGGKDDQLGRALLHALRNAGISVLYQDKALKTVWARNMRAPWDSDDTDPIGSEAGGALPPLQTERIQAARRNVVATGNPERLEINVPGATGMRWFEVWVDADRAEDGSILGVVTTKVETTEQKRREQTLKTLLREVSHR